MAWPLNKHVKKIEPNYKNLRIFVKVSKLYTVKSVIAPLPCPNRYTLPKKLTKADKTCQQILHG